MKKLVSFVLLSIAYLLLILAVSYLPDLYITIGVGLIGSLVLTKLVFVIVDEIYPPNQVLVKDAKSFFNSKIFWLALLNFLSAVVEGLFSLVIDADTLTEVVNLDWTNIIRALGSVVVIVIRKYDILRYLK